MKFKEVGKIKVYFFTVLVLFFVSCSLGTNQKSKAENSESAVPSNRVEQSVIAEKLLVGVVRDAESDKPLEGIIVVAGDMEAKTEYDGSFKIPLDWITIKKGKTLVSIDAPGYATYKKPVLISDAEITYLNVYIKRVGVVEKIDNLSPVPQIVKDPKSGSQLIFPPRLGLPEPLIISMTYFDPKNEKDMLAAPGNFTGIIGGVRVELISYGMLDVQAVGVNSGRRYDRLDMPVQVVMPIPDGSPQDVPFWDLDQNTGDWTENGVAEQQIINEEAVFLANEKVFVFTPKNLDIPIDETTSISGKIDNSNPWDTMYSISVTGFGRSAQLSSRYNEFVVRPLPLNFPGTLVITDLSTGVTISRPFVTNPDSTDKFIGYFYF